jgi:hypothetical protein
MRSQKDDLLYGSERERVNHPIIEKHLGVKLEKLEKFHIMDWKEVPTDENPPWNVEQKSRTCSYDFCRNNYYYNGRPTVLIGKHKIDYMGANGGNGVVYIDFTDKLMYWVYDEEEYKTFDIEKKFVRNQRSDYVDKPSDVAHIPIELLKAVEL